MTINLTEIGWTDENGILLGTWTNQSDVVSDDTAIIVAEDLIINTMNGDDVINGDVNDSDNQSEGIRIDNYSQLNTNNGNDTITGTGFDGFFLKVSSSINTGLGNDTITGSGFAVGISSRGTINTGNGDDTIIASAEGPPDDLFGSTGISNYLGTINTGAGNDTILASGNSLAISNDSGTINTGAGNDTIDALTGGFSDSNGSGQINLGQGDDLIRGFGDHRGNINGGRGYDQAELGFDYDETSITFGSTNSTSIDITFDSTTMSYTNIESFDFNGQTFSLESLQAMA
ncbi:MAG: hypothetical protein RLZZ171_1976 [Cyanobacteriota bacterium]|jgi:hypothetical protein